MFKTLLILCVAFAVAIHGQDLSKMPAHAESINVNQLATTWKAGFNKNFEGATMQDVKNLCGTDLAKEQAVTLPRKIVEVPEDLPTDFDARTGFPQCSNVIGHIRDQSDCGSCWAFGSTEAFNDRMCIASNGTFQTLLSVQDTTSCCDLFKCFSFGCGGGQPSNAWSYFVNYGVVTGGDYDDTGKTDTCLPYFLPKCSHHVNNPNIANCSSDEKKAPACPTTCSNKYGTSFTEDKHKAKSSYSVSGADQIAAEIVKNGPVTGAFTVYADFPTYKQGVYKHVSGSALGGHAIKVMGFGTENGTPYWLVANSWNSDWGDHGTFKIARGNDECGIESSISAGLA